MLSVDAAAVVGVLDGVLLDQHPLETAVLERLDEFVGDVRMVGERHLRGREPANPTEGLQSEEGREMMLPRLDVQTVILDRRRRCHGMPPRTAEPFGRMSVVRIASDGFQDIQNIVQPHLPHAVEQRTRVFEHGTRLLAFFEQLRDELADALVAPGEGGSVVVVADVLIVPHVLEIANDLGGFKFSSTGGDQRLVHVQGDRAGGFDVLEIDGGVRCVDWTLGRIADRFLDLFFGAGEIERAVDVFG